MLELLFNASFWYGLLIAAIVIVIVWICGKYPSARVFVLTGVVIVVSIVLLGGSIYCGVNLNAYYNERGGIFGAITGIFETNTSEVVDEMDIKINNIELIQENGDVYSATIMIDKVLDLDDGTQYGIYVNDNFVDNIDNPNYARAEYTYTFQNNSLTELLTDTLILDFAFDSTSTTLIVTTNGGVDAVSYWNSYFNKNNFIISIEESNYNPGNDLTYTDGEAGEYFKVQYYAEGSYLYSKLYILNSTITETYHVSGKTFLGWSLTEGGEIISSDYKVVQDINLYAILEENSILTWTTMNWKGLSSFNALNIWNDGTNVYYSSGTEQYILDKNNQTWLEMTWNGINSVSGQNVWTDGKDYYLYNSVNFYKLNVETHTWSIIGINWDFADSFQAIRVWTDGTNTYYSFGLLQLVLNKDTLTWEEMIWNGLSNIYGNSIWSDGTNIYSSSGTEQYILNTETNTWEEMIWNGLTSFSATSIWSDGSNYYCSNGSETYVLEKETNTWTIKTCEGLIDFIGRYVWSDGSETYYSLNENQYILR